MKEGEYLSSDAYTDEWKITDNDDDVLKEPDRIHSVQQIDLSENVWAYIRRNKDRATGELRWLNATFKDEEQKVDLLYDYGYLTVAFRGDPEERKTRPYQAVISISFTPDNAVPRRTTAKQHSSFWYDKTGEIALVKLDQHHQDTALAFKRKDKSTGWIILRNDELEGIFKTMNAGKDFTLDDLKIGEIDVGIQQEIEELNYLIDTQDNRFKLSYQTLTGQHETTFDLPYRIDLERWNNILLGERWPEVLNEFQTRFSIN